MEVGLVNIFFNWLLHIDLACIVCNWDPATQSWIPFGAAGAAAGTGLGLNDLFGQTPGGGVGNPPAPPGGWGSLPPPYTPHPEDVAPPDGPTYGGPPPDPHTVDPVNQFDPTSRIEDRAAADERERQRQNDLYRVTHPGATTAGPPPPTAGAAAGDAAYNAFFTVGTRPKVVE